MATTLFRFFGPLFEPSFVQCKSESISYFRLPTELSWKNSNVQRETNGVDATLPTSPESSSLRVRLKELRKNLDGHYRHGSEEKVQVQVVHSINAKARSDDVATSTNKTSRPSKSKKEQEKLQPEDDNKNIASKHLSNLAKAQGPLSTRECTNWVSELQLETDEFKEIWLSLGSPQPVYRICKENEDDHNGSSESGSRAMIWLCYPDLIEKPLMEFSYPAKEHLHTSNRPSGSRTSKPYSGKTNRLRARRNISRGEVIVRERPVFLFPRFLPLFLPVQDQDRESNSAKDVEAEAARNLEKMRAKRKAQEDIIGMGIEYLDPVIKARVLKMSGLQNYNYEDDEGEDKFNKSDEDLPLTSLMERHSLCCDFPNAKVKSYGGICLDISRVGHSCVPNSIYRFNSKDVYVELRAIRPITKGTEITIAYIETLNTRHSRLKELEGRYQLSCRCEACTLPLAWSLESDLQRLTIEDRCLKIEQSFNAWFVGTSTTATSTGSKSKSKPRGVPPVALLVEELVVLLRLIEKERLDSELGVPIRWLAHTYAALGDVEMFVKWAEKAVKCVPLLIPAAEDSSEKFDDGGKEGEGELKQVCDVWKDWLDDPTTHPLWGLREDQRGF